MLKIKWTKKAAVLVCLLSLLLIVFRASRQEMAGGEVLQALLLTAGAEIVAGEVQFYAILDERYRSMAELEETMLSVAELLGLMGGEVQQGEGETYRVLEVTGPTTLGVEVQVVLQSNPGATDLGSGPQTYLLIVCRDASPEKINTMVMQLNQRILPLAPQGQISFYLTGQLPGKRTGEEMGQMARRALQALGATVVEGIEEETLISLTAHTPLLKEEIFSDGQRFNLNLAVRYDDFHDKTVLWAGFPIIHGSY